MLHCLPSSTHELPSLVLHNSARVFSAYSVTGKKPLVQVFGIKDFQIPAVLSVYCGYIGGLDSFLATARILEEMSGEYSSTGGVAAVAKARKNKRMIVKGNIIACTGGGKLFDRVKRGHEAIYS